MPGKAKVMAIGLDAADPGLVREYAAAGVMPSIARLLSEGAEMEIRGPMGVFVSANWPTIFTATRPDRHGYLCWDEYRGGTYEYRTTDPTMNRGTPVWRPLSQQGKRVAVFDLPHSTVEEVNGAMIAEWGCHDRHFGTRSSPELLAGELMQRHGKHFGSMRDPGFPQFAPCDYAHRAGNRRTPDETVAFWEAVRGGVQSKRGASLELLDRGGWDLFWSVLGETHCTGHQFWHLHRHDHPEYDGELVERLGGDPVRTVYNRIDSVLGEHLDRLGPDDTAYVLMPHGMTSHHDGDHILDDLLWRLDRWLDDPARYGRATQAAGEAARLIPEPLRGAALRRAAPLIRSRAGAPARDQIPPLAERRFFQVPNNTAVGAVRLNLEGREPCGRIHPSDQRRVLRWIGDRLKELVNVETGAAVVREVELTDDVYARKPGDAFADLYIEWERRDPIERIWSPATGTLAVPYEHWRQGDHLREGLLLAVGPGIRPGRRRSVIDSIDIGATFAAAAGAELPDADGRPVASILPAGARGSARRRRAKSLAKQGLDRSIRRSAGRRVPAWARRGDPGLERLRSDLSARADAADDQVAELNERVEELERHSKIAAMQAWLPHATVAEQLAVSVVMPTRDRRELLEQAIASVQAQSYPHWELLVVDDGSTDDTPDFLAAIEDPRVRALRTGGAGVCGARNRALDSAHGDLIAYLDDDNRFDPHWLKAAVLAFNAHPDRACCYGARVFDDEGRVTRGEGNGLPGIQFVRWDADAIREHNFVDMNVIAHRRSPVRFDTELSFYGDWDLLLRLCPDRDPVEVPAIAAYYRSDVERMSNSLPAEELDREYLHVRRKLAEVALG